MGRLRDTDSTTKGNAREALSEKGGGGDLPAAGPAVPGVTEKLPKFGLAEDILGRPPSDTGTDKASVPVEPPVRAEPASVAQTAMQALAKHVSGSTRMQRASPVDGMQLVDEGGEASDNEKGLVQLVTFHLDKEEYGLPIAEVREINRVTEITAVPNSPEHVVGVVNLRGRIVPVIDLKRRLRLGATSVGEESRVVVVEYGSKVLGLMVDRVAQVLRLPSEQIDAAPEETVRLEENFTRGVGKMNDRMIIILDLERIIWGQQQTHSAGRPAAGA